MTIVPTNYTQTAKLQLRGNAKDPRYPHCDRRLQRPAPEAFMMSGALRGFASDPSQRLPGASGASKTTIDILAPDDKLVLTLPAAVRNGEAVLKQQCRKTVSSKTILSSLVKRGNAGRSTKEKHAEIQGQTVGSSISMTVPGDRAAEGPSMRRPASLQKPNSNASTGQT
jgi:hypothetical protein